MAAMICPVCEGMMKESRKAGVLIDVCTGCRGVWLDRSELEKLAAVVDPQPLDAPQDRPGRHLRGVGEDDLNTGSDWDDDHRSHRHRRYRSPSKLSRLMDFFD